MGDALKSTYLRATAIDYAKHFIGVPYAWGGDDPMAGFDCSGLIVEVLQAVGLIPDGADFTAAALYDKFQEQAVATPYGGCLVFCFSGTKVYHVELMVDDYHTVGASGGGPNTHNQADAIRQNAFVKMRPLSHLGNNVLSVDPFKHTQPEPTA